MTDAIQITINGEAQSAQPGLTVAALLAHLKLNPDRLAIERNLEILPRAQWDQTIVAEGDRFEIVHLVGGG